MITVRVRRLEAHDAVELFEFLIANLQSPSSDQIRSLESHRSWTLIGHDVGYRDVSLYGSDESLAAYIKLRWG